MSASTINSDLTTLKELLYWMVKQGYMSSDMLFDIPKIKDRKNYREEANPAFLPDEFIRFKDELYKYDFGCKMKKKNGKKMVYSLGFICTIPVAEFTKPVRLLLATGCAKTT